MTGEPPADTRSQRFCTWLHRRRWVLLAAWVLHATILHLVWIGFPSWDAFSYRLPPIVELIQHGELNLDHYNQWALHGYVPFAELAQLPLLYALGQVGLLLSYPLIVFPLCAVGVYKLGKQLTGSVHGGNFAALAWAAVPMVNQQPFTGYIDFIVSAVVAYFLYAVLQLRDAPRPLRAAIRVAIATVLFTMTRATGLYIGVMLSGLLYLALYVERDAGRLRLVRRRELAITIAAFAVGALPVIAVQIYKYVHHGSPLYPYQFNLLGFKVGTGVPTKDLFFYAGLADETWRNFARNAFGAWIWPLARPLMFFDSRNLGGGWVLIAALIALPGFVRSATRLERWLVIICVIVSLFARDFWLPRWAYTIVVAIAIVLGRALPALASSARRRDRWLFGLLTALLLVHFARPELDLWQLRGWPGIGPRLNAASSPYFKRARGGFDPYPDVNARFIIIDVNANGFLLPIYGPHLSNEVLFTLPADQVGERCAGLRGVAALHPGVLFIDDLDHTIDCDRACALPLRHGCGAYRYFVKGVPPAVEPWTSVAAGARGTSWLRSGWSYPEPWGVWSTGSDSELAIPVPATGVELLLDFEWFSSADAMTVELEVAGERHRVAFDHVQVPRKQTFILKPVAASPLIVHIHVDRPFHAGDGRMLGVGINRVRLRTR